MPETCGAGCAFVGATGIEIATPFFESIYNGVINDNEYEQIIFYEMSRNYWSFGDWLDYGDAGDNADWAGVAILEM